MPRAHASFRRSALRRGSLRFLAMAALGLGRGAYRRAHHRQSVREAHKKAAGYSRIRLPLITRYAK